MNTNTKRAIIAILLATLATIVCIKGSQEEPVPKKTIKLVFMQEHSMVDYGAAETYVTDKIDEKKAKVEEYEKRKAEYQERAKVAYEEYLAALAQQRKARQAASQVTYSEPTTPVESSSVEGGYLGSFKCTGYVATGNTCANGNYPTSGYTIASNSLPMGTRVYIEGIGERVVEDTGGMDVGTLDIFCNSVDECYALTGNYDVYIIEE